MTDEVSTNTRLAVIANDMSYLKEAVHSIDSKLTNNYVTKPELLSVNERLKRLERTGYAIITVIGLSVLYALLNVIGLGKP